MKTLKRIIILAISLSLFLLATVTGTYAVDPCSPSPEDSAPDQSRGPGSGFSPGGTPPTGIPGPDTGSDFGSGGPGIPNIPDTITYPESWNLPCGWVFKGNICGLGGSVTWYDYGGSGVGFDFMFEYISDNKKQYQVSATNYYSHAECGEVPGICQEWNNINCPEDYRNNNCIDGDYAGYYPYTCEEGSYHCFCVKELAYYEWECP